MSDCPLRVICLFSISKSLTLGSGSGRLPLLKVIGLYILEIGRYPSKNCRLIVHIFDSEVSLNTAVSNGSETITSTVRRSGKIWNFSSRTKQFGRRTFFLCMASYQRLIAFSSGVLTHASPCAIVGPRSPKRICLNTVHCYCMRFAGSRGCWLNRGHNIAFRTHTSGSVFRLWPEFKFLLATLRHYIWVARNSWQFEGLRPDPQALVEKIEATFRFVSRVQQRATLTSFYEQEWLTGGVLVPLLTQFDALVPDERTPAHPGSV